jgi:hypothetical protein
MPEKTVKRRLQDCDAALASDDGPIVFLAGFPLLAADHRRRHLDAHRRDAHDPRLGGSARFYNISSPEVQMRRPRPSAMILPSYFIFALLVVL